MHKIVSNLCRLEEGDLLGYSDGNAALHAAIIEAIAAHDEETAEKAMRQHLGQVESTLTHTTRRFVGEP